MLKGEEGANAMGEEEPEEGAEEEFARVSMGEPAGEAIARAEGRLFLFAW
jgi:hypothetical protein